MEEEQKNASPSIMENVPLFLSRLELNFEKNRMNYVQIHAKYIPLHTSTVSQKVGHTSRSFCAFFIFYCISILKHLLLTQFGKEKIENGSCYLE